MRPTHHLVLNVRFRVTKSTVKVKSCGKGPSVSIYFACKLVSSGYAYPLNIAEFPYIYYSEIVNFKDFRRVDCCGCRIYTVIKLSTDCIQKVVNTD